MQTQWASQLNPLVASPIMSGHQLKNVSLAMGDNVVPHGLGKILTGWMIVRQRATAALFDKQDSTQLTNLNLTLNASAPVVVDLWVY